MLLVVGALALQVSCWVMLTGFASLATGEIARANQAMLNPWTLGAVNTGALALVLALGLRVSGEPPVRFFSIRSFIPALLPAVLLTSLSLAVVMQKSDALIVELLQRLPGVGPIPSDPLKLAAYPAGGFLLLVVIAPFTEEYLFRRMILRGLLARHRPLAAIGISALLFGLMHANIPQLILGLVIGAVFGWWYARTCSVGPGLIGHAAFNGVAWSGTVLSDVMAAPGVGSYEHPAARLSWSLTAGCLALAGLGLWRFKAICDAAVPAAPPRLAESSIPPLLAAQRPDSPAS
ncbi:MAG: CPBP family intramembrane metalloprotease [Opitutae bacterium]|nr:CPBP family intramembrane metalloprotease [Opitutae bacterium]